MLEGGLRVSWWWPRTLFVPFKACSTSDLGSIMASKRGEVEGRASSPLKKVLQK